MQEVKEFNKKQNKNDFLSKMANINTENISDENLLSQLNSFKMVFKQVNRTPTMVMNMLQMESDISFKYYINSRKETDDDTLKLLKNEWDGDCFIVPRTNKKIPIEKWIDKCIYESETNNNTCVLLIPSSTSTKWFHHKVLTIAEVLFIEGRLKFDGNSKAAQFSNAIAIYYSGDDRKQNKKIQNLDFIKSASFKDGHETNFAVLSSITDTEIKLEFNEKNSMDIYNENEKENND